MIVCENTCTIKDASWILTCDGKPKAFEQWSIEEERRDICELYLEKVGLY